MSAGILDFEELAEACGDGSVSDAEVTTVVSDALRAFELCERNANALATWKMCSALRTHFPDAARSPVERLIFDRWFDTRREAAQAWLSRSWFFRRQAD